MCLVEMLRKKRHTVIRKILKVTFLAAFEAFDKQIQNYRSICILQKQRTLAARSVQTNVPRAIHTYIYRQTAIKQSCHL